MKRWSPINKLEYYSEKHPRASVAMLDADSPANWDRTSDVLEWHL